MYKLIFTLSIYLSTILSLLAQNNNILIENKVDSIFNQWDKPDVPGLAVAVVKDGRIVLQKSYGLANLEYNIPITISTVFHSASLAKQFTSYAILTLEEDGLISLDDDVRKYIPEVPDFGKTIKLRHLATHTSGLKDQWRLLEIAGWRLDDVITTEHIISLVKRQKSLNFEPGEKVLYSNTGFTLLAEVVTRVSGKTFAEYTKERVFKPLKMENSLFYDNYKKIVKNRAYAYQKDEGGYVKTKLNFSTVGATSLFTTVEDMCKWANHLNNSTGNAKNIIKKMNTLAHLNDGSITEAALGQWGGTKYNGLEWFDHTGSDAGYRAYFSRFPEINAAVVLLANTPNVNTRRLSYKTVNLFIKDHFVSKPEKDKVEEGEKIQPSHKFVNLSNNKLLKYSGKYFELNEWYNREIVVKDDTLNYIRTNGTVSKLAPVSKDEFVMLGESIDVRVIFSNNKTGEMTMNVKIEGRSSEAKFVRYSQLEGNQLKGTFFSKELGSTYKLASSEGKLYFTNQRLGKIPLVQVTPNLLTSKNRNFKKIKIMRNLKGNIRGINVSNYGMRNIEFTKL